MRKLFGTDGIRGLVEKDLTTELAFKLGRVFGLLIEQERLSGPWSAVIGRDTRLSCKAIEEAVSSGLSSQGVNVSLVGVIPTPGLAFLAKIGGFDGGVMISASHNSAEYNGIKFLSHNGFKLSEEIESEIERAIANYEQVRFPDTPPGLIEHNTGLSAKYLEYLKQIEKSSLSGLKIVIDMANGATYSIGPRLFAACGADVIPISDKPDGMNINLNCGSTHLDALQKAVTAHRADAGLAFDGDGDRVLAVDENGETVDGDQIVLIEALEMAQNGKLRNNMVVATVMSNYGFEAALQKHHITLKRTSVGDRYVVEEMVASGAVLGGEQSGHVVFLDYNTTGDGLITGLKLLATMKRSGRKLSVLSAEMERYPQVQLNVSVRSMQNLDRNPTIKTAISIAEDQIQGKGRIVIRASGTEPLIRIMVEGKDYSLINQLARKLADSIQSEANAGRI
jgi:phosphoglucosamine mutase